MFTIDAKEASKIDLVLAMFMDAPCRFINLGLTDNASMEGKVTGIETENGKDYVVVLRTRPMGYRQEIVIRTMD